MVNDVGSYTRVNVDNSYRAGVEISAIYKVIKSLSLNVSIAGSILMHHLINTKN